MKKYEMKHCCIMSFLLICTLLRRRALMPRKLNFCWLDGSCNQAIDKGTQSG